MCVYLCVLAIGSFGYVESAWYNHLTCFNVSAADERWRRLILRYKNQPTGYCHIVSPHTLGTCCYTRPDVIKCQTRDPQTGLSNIILKNISSVGRTKIYVRQTGWEMLEHVYYYILNCIRWKNKKSGLEKRRSVVSEVEFWVSNRNQMHLKRVSQNLY